MTEENKSLIPRFGLPFVIPKTSDEIERSEMTLKDLRKLAKEMDISILGPKGGLITKKPLLERIEEVFGEKEQERINEIKKKKEIVSEHNDELIKYKEVEMNRKKKEVLKMRVEAQRINQEANALETDIRNLKAVIATLKEGI